MIPSIITEREMELMGVASLPTRPTAPREFGGKGYTPAELKAAFDRLPRLIAERFNNLLVHIADGTYLNDIPYENTVSLREHLETLTEELSAELMRGDEQDKTLSLHETNLVSHTERLHSLDAEVASIAVEMSNIGMDVSLINELLFKGLIACVEVEDTFEMRQTAGGLNIVDGVKSTVKKICGASVTSKNIMPVTYTTRTISGVSFTVNDDGSVLVNGTASAATTYSLVVRGSLTSIATGDVLSLSGTPTGGSSTSYRMVVSRGDGYTPDYGSGCTFTVTDEAALGITISIGSGTVCNNLLFKPMLVRGEVISTEFVPYFTGIKSAQFKGIKSTNSNLILYPYHSGTMTKNGMTFTDLGDGTVRVYGNPTAITLYYLFYATEEKPYLYIKKGTYRLSIGKSATYLSYNATGIDGENFVNTETIISRAAQRDLYLREISIKIVNNTSETIDFIASPRLNLGSIALTMDVGKNDTSFALAEQVELGKWDYIDLPSKKLVRQTQEVSFSGDEAWKMYSYENEGEGQEHVYYLEQALASDVCSREAICTRYAFLPSSGMPDADGSFDIKEDGTLMVHDNTCTALDAWCNHLSTMSAAGDPVMVAYKHPGVMVEDIDMSDGYTAWAGGSETVEPESICGAQCTTTQSYYMVREGASA